MKKILSLFTVVCLLLSCGTTVFAGYSTKVEYVGATDSEWELNVPIKMAPGETANVTLDGTWDAITTIIVDADDTVTLSNDINDETKTLDINFNGIVKVGNNDSEISVTEEISLSDISGALFGTWSGIFNYSLTMDFEGIEGSAVVNGVGYATLQDAIDNATNNSTVVLMSDVEESVIIPEDKTLTIDLNGYNITGEYIDGINLTGLDNLVAYSPIANKGTLTIIGDGVIDGRTDACPALFNMGTAYVKGGTYTRSTQYTGTENQPVRLVNAQYTVLNVGEMTISDGANIGTTGLYVSSLANGTKEMGFEVLHNMHAKLYIEGGNITGGRHAVSNNYGDITITGGYLYSGTFDVAKDVIGLDCGTLSIYGGSIISTTGTAITAEDVAIIVFGPNDYTFEGEIVGNPFINEDGGEL